MMNGDGLMGVFIAILIGAGVLGWALFAKFFPWLWTFIRPLIHAWTA